MKKWKFILGVDVSKLTLDVHCSELNLHIKIENGSKGFTALKKWCNDNQIILAESLIVMEYTGGYEYKLIQFCESFNIQFCRIPGLAIKNSLGISRGKNDKVDAKRIAQYADEKYKTIEPSKPLNKAIINLKELLSIRKRFVRENAGYKASMKERLAMYEVSKNDYIIKAYSQKIKANIKTIDMIETEIMNLINKDEKMKLNYKIITSIKGIGMVNALMTIAYTENFISFDNPRKYAVYAGVVPFDHDSGTSVKGRKRVSNLANKELKQELNQAAKTAIIYDKDLKEYAEKKLQVKCYGIVLNNVKFKLILRMFSLVKRGELNVENYKKAA